MTTPARALSAWVRRHALDMRKAPRQRGLSWVLQRTTESILAPAPTGAMERPAMEDLGGA